MDVAWERYVRSERSAQAAMHRRRNGATGHEILLVGSCAVLAASVLRTCEGPAPLLTVALGATGVGAGAAGAPARLGASCRFASSTEFLRLTGCSYGLGGAGLRRVTNLDKLSREVRRPYDSTAEGGEAARDD